MRVVGTIRFECPDPCERIKFATIIHCLCGAVCRCSSGGIVPVGTAFHERTLALCESLNYREWSGYYTVSVYETHHEHEYNAIRNSAALIDISPLFKYRVTGRDASKFVNRMISRDINKVAVNQVIYCCWCDPEWNVMDDGTITRLGENEYRWTA